MNAQVKWLLQYCAGMGLRHFPTDPGLFRAFTFHGISDAAAFDRMLRHLVDAYDVITPQEAEKLIEGKAVPGKGKTRYLLTFDDGFRCHGGLVKDILGRYGLKAIFFICPGIMEMPHEAQKKAILPCLYDPPFPEVEVPDALMPLRWGEAEGLLRDGHTIGSHTCDHRRLFDLDDQTLSYELIKSAEIIKNKLGFKPDWFAFPFGDLKSMDERSLRLAHQHYRFICSNIPAANPPESAGKILFRMGFDLQTPFVYQRMVLAGGADFRATSKVQTLLDRVERSIAI